MATILVTGGAGFIGSHLVSALVGRGDRVVVLDDFSTGRLENLQEITGRYQLVEGSLLDPQALQSALVGVDAVLHQAAMPSVPKSVARPIETHRANVEGTLSLLEACRRSGIKRVVYAASSSAYGDCEVDIKHEDLVARPGSPYAVQKLTGEYYLRVFAELFGMETISLRYFNVFGPRQNPNSEYAAVVPAFITRVICGLKPIIYGNGLQSRDFTYVGNVVDANLAALSAPPSAWGKVFNVACGGKTTLVSLLNMICHLLGTEIEPEFHQGRLGDVLHSCASVELAGLHMGWHPKISVLDGLKTTVQWYQTAFEKAVSEVT